MSWKPLSRITQCLAAAFCLVALFGCETNNVPSGSRYVVSTPKAPFYKFGPAQSFGPDFVLDEGAKVIMLEHSFGYSHVMTADGTSGFVATEDLKPDLQKYTTSPNAKSNYTLQLNRPMFDQPKHSNVAPTHGSPLFDPSDNPLPQGTPPPSTLPGFRY
ncbi:MAG TPA: hypothetical protein VGM54_09675 [Chthoniobacter sp.]|jgi:hypothetical protein